jgi:hypothetical protein
LNLVDRILFGGETDNGKIDNNTMVYISITLAVVHINNTTEDCSKETYKTLVETLKM